MNGEGGDKYPKKSADIISFETKVAERSKKLRERRENLAKIDPNVARALEHEKELEEIDKTLAENEKDSHALVIQGRITKEYKYKVIPQWDDRPEIGAIGKQIPFLEALEQRLQEMDPKLRRKIFRASGACTVFQRSYELTELSAEFRFTRFVKDRNVTVSLADKEEFNRVMTEYAKTLWF